MSGIVVETKNGRKWFRTGFLTVSDLEESIDRMPEAKVEKMYRKAVKEIGNSPNDEQRAFLSDFRKYIFYRKSNGIYNFTGRAEKERMPFRRNLVESIGSN